MAVKGRIDGKTNSTKYDTWLAWSRNSVKDNKSNITVIAYVQRNDGYSDSAHNTGTKPTVTLKVGGAEKTPTISYIDTRNSKQCAFATWTGDVSHKDDGTLALSLSCTWSMSGSSSLSNGSISGTATLDTIPRATTPSLSSNELIANGSDSVAIYLTPASSTFKHRFRYAFGSFTSAYMGFYNGNTEMGQTDYTPAGECTIYFKPNATICNEIPNALSGVCKITCYTYTASGTLVGTKTVSLTINVPTYTPTFTTHTLTPVNALGGKYVEGKSSIKVGLAAKSEYGATIKGFSTVIDGKTYTGSNFTTALLTKGENKPVKVTVTDTRGRTATLNLSPISVVYEYSAPRINSFSIVRQGDGTTAVATVGTVVSLVGGANVPTITVTLNGLTKTVDGNGKATFTGISTDTAYTATAKVTDAYHPNGITLETVLPTVFVLLDFHSSGKGIAIGKVATESNLFDIALPTKFSGRIEGNVLGLGELPLIPSYADLNDEEYLAPGCWGIDGNGIATTLGNCPCDYAGRLEVFASLGTTNSVNREFYYATQRYITLDPQFPVYERLCIRENGVWRFNDWRTR